MLPLSAEGASVFGSLKYRYQKATGISTQAIKKHNNDFIMASIAVAENATLVSNDAIYSRIAELKKGLSVENWARRG